MFHPICIQEEAIVSDPNLNDDAEPTASAVESAEDELDGGGAGDGED